MTEPRAPVACEALEAVRTGTLNSVHISLDAPFLQVRRVADRFGLPWSTARLIAELAFGERRDGTALPHQYGSR